MQPIRDIVYQCTALNGTGKQGILTPDEHGYFTICVGALKTYNSRNEYYTEQGVLGFFEKDSEFQRWVGRGCLKAEYGHPKFEKGMTDEEWLGRITRIEETLVCAHFSAIWLEYSDGKDTNGKPVILIMAKVCPSGPYGAFLEKSLLNPKENVCFSVRAFTERFQQGFNIVKRITEIMAFDLVTEPGIAQAEKFKSPSLEAFTLRGYNGEMIAPEHELILDRGVINRAQALIEKTPGIAMEHSLAQLQRLVGVVSEVAMKQNPPAGQRPLCGW